MIEVDFTTTIAKLQSFIKDAKEAIEDVSINEFIFRILKPLRNSSLDDSSEEPLECIYGRIDIRHERQLKKADDKLTEKKG